MVSISRTKRPAIQLTLELTLGDLPSTSSSRSATRRRWGIVCVTRSRALEHLSPADLHFLIGQGIGASLVVPLALELLDAIHSLGAVGEPGDLLAAVFGTALSHVTAREHLRERARAVLAVAERRLSTGSG